MRELGVRHAKCQARAYGRGRIEHDGVILRDAVNTEGWSGWEAWERRRQKEGEFWSTGQKACSARAPVPPSRSPKKRGRQKGVSARL